MRYLFVVLLFSFHLFCVRASTEALHFTQYTTANGLSNNRVYCILQDTRGFLWIGTLDGLNRYDGYGFKVYKNISDDSASLPVNRVMSLFEDSQGTIWMSSKNEGVSKYNPSTDKFYCLSDSGIDKVQLPQNFNILPDGVVPLTNHAEFVRRVKAYFGIDVEISTVLQNNGYFWYGTFQHGLFRQNLATGVVTHFIDAPMQTSMFIRQIYADNFGGIWIGTNNSGLFKFNPEVDKFRHIHEFTRNGQRIVNFTVRTMHHTINNEVLLGTFNQGLVAFQPDMGTFRYLNWQGSSLKVNDLQVRSIYKSRDNTIYCGGYFGLLTIDAHTFSVTGHARLENTAVTPNPFDSRVYNIDEDYFGKLWIANWDNLVCYDPSTGKANYYPKSQFGVDNIRDVKIDGNNILWIGCEIGGLVRYNLRTGFHQNINTESGLSSNNVFHVHEDKHQNLWVATFHGLNKLDAQGKVQQIITSRDGLPSDMIYGILEDVNGYLWLTSSNGLVRYHPDMGTIAVYDKRYGLQDNEFTEGAFHRMPSGHFVVGGVRGFNIFHPDSIRSDTVRPKVYLTGLRIMNQPVDQNDLYQGRRILHQPIEHCRHLELDYADKIFTIEFAGLHFNMPERNRYRFMLEGFDKQWMYTTADRRIATYTNLPPGHYTFYVEASNADGYWSAEPLQVTIDIKPPVWGSWYAYLFYIGVLTLLLLLFRQISLKSVAIKNELKLEKSQREKSEELNKEKLDFFISISHELRTPLTLILGPVNAVLNSDLNLPASTFVSKFEVVQRNAKRLLNLINQMMDLSKLDAGKLKITPAKVDLGIFIDSLLSYYHEISSQHKVNIRFNQLISNAIITVDADKLEKIVSNLVSNAVKFTPKGGEVVVMLNDAQTLPDSTYDIHLGKLLNKAFLEIVVKDTGIGIPTELLDKIFHRFYQVSNSVSFDMKGSGIGLSLVKELTELLGGEVLVKSSESEGSTFTVRLPRQPAYDNAIVSKPTEQTSYSGNIPILSPSEDAFEDEPDNIQKKDHVLVVEDNAELRCYIQELLGGTYRVSLAENGKHALEKLSNELPDIIISDIMMPEMDGIEFCQRVKNDISTSHIPFIMLTANTRTDIRIEGLNKGTDSFLTKPFETEVLLARLDNLLENRKKLREFYGERFTGTSDKSVPLPSQLLSPQDEAFMLKLQSTIESNIHMADFGVEHLSSELGMSRSNLHKKLKSITDKNASELIRASRLKQALLILKTGEHNVEEVSYKVGFNTPSYFIKYFKAQYGQTPKQFLLGKGNVEPDETIT